MGGGSAEASAPLTFCSVVRFFLLFIITKAVPRTFLLNKILLFKNYSNDKTTFAGIFKFDFETSKTSYKITRIPRRKR